MFKKNVYGKPEVSEMIVWGVDSLSGVGMKHFICSCLNFLQVDWQNCKNCNHQPLHFNISHTDSLIACGVTVHVPVSLLIRHITYSFVCI